VFGLPVAARLFKSVQRATESARWHGKFLQSDSEQGSPTCAIEQLADKARSHRHDV